MKLKRNILTFFIVLIALIFSYNISKADITDDVHIESMECGVNQMGDVVVSLVSSDGTLSYSCTTDASNYQCNILAVNSGEYTVTATKSGYILTNDKCEDGVTSVSFNTSPPSTLEVYLKPICNNNGTCDAGEDIFNCKTDCISPTMNIPTLSIPDILDNIISWVLGIGLMIAVTFLIFGGLYYSSSSGDEEKTQTAKRIVKYSLMGVLVIGVSYAIIAVLDKIFMP